MVNKRAVMQTLLYLAVGTLPTAQADPATTGIHITLCSVYSEQAYALQSDCTDQAAHLCSGLDFCELPIGLNLTDGKDIDNNEASWELVRVEYACAGKPRFNGPHYQNDHATMSLFCRR